MLAVDYGLTVPYPSRPVLEVRRQFRGVLTGRTRTAVRRSLDRTGAPRRGRGARRVSEGARCRRAG